MKDRVPLYPGRVTLTPVSGQANTFDLVRADQPTQEGTPLNKASLLKDTTAALFGKTNAAVPDDILNLLSKSVIAQGTKITDVLGNLISIPADQIKDGVKIATGLYIGTGTYGIDNPNSLTFGFKPKIIWFVSYHQGTDNLDFLNFPIGPDGNEAYAPVVVMDTIKTTYTNTSAPYYYNYRGSYSRKSFDGTTLQWYHTQDSAYQLNNKGFRYAYVAIG